MSRDLNYLTSHRGDSAVRAVLSDYELTVHGRKSRALHALSLTTDATAATATTTAESTADAAARDAADADAADDADFSSMLAKEIEMREGLVLLKLPGYYGPVRVGWLRRLEGDNYELLPGSVLVVRTSGNRKLAEIAAAGPKSDHRCEDRAETSMDVNEFRVWQCWQANEKAWAAECPHPTGWAK